MRLRDFQSYLNQNQIDLAFLVHPDLAITYFTQFKPSFAYLLISSRYASIYLTKLDPHSKINSIKVETFPKNWEEHLSDFKIKRVGINIDSLTVKFLDKLKKIYPKAQFVDISSKLKQLRESKTSEEVQLISKACKITSTAFSRLVDELPLGRLKTERDVSLFLERHIKDNQADLAFPTIVAMGKNAAIPHHITSTQKLRRGFLVLDFGACYNNYCADMTRVIFLGQHTAKEKSFYDLLLASQLQAVREVALGRNFLDLDQVVRAKLGKYSSHLIHSLGHGIGLEVHEDPSFGDGAAVKLNQTFTIEPGIYFPHKFGLRIEDTLHFDQKTKILTTATKDLFKINLT